MIAFFQHKNKSLLYPIRNLDYPAHLHRAVEFGFLEEGSGTISVEGTCYQLEAGDVFVIFPDRVHLFENCCNVQGFLGIALPEEFPFLQSFFSDAFPSSPVIEKEAVFSHGIHHLFHTASEDPDLEKKGVLHGYLALLLGKILPLLPRDEKKNPKQEDLHRILLYLEKNFRENLSRRTVSREMGISESSLSHLFSSSLHVSFPAYLTLLRMEEARHLLAQTELPVTAIVSAAGFPSLRTMNRAFRTHLGKSPSAYRTEILEISKKEKDNET